MLTNCSFFYTQIRVLLNNLYKLLSKLNLCDQRSKSKTKLMQRGQYTVFFRLICAATSSTVEVWESKVQEQTNKGKAIYFQI